MCTSSSGAPLREARKRSLHTVENMVNPSSRDDVMAVRPSVRPSAVRPYAFHDCVSPCTQENKIMAALQIRVASAFFVLSRSKKKNHFGAPNEK